MNALEIELAIAKHFNYRTNIIVPNVWWGLGLDYEADLVVLRSSGYAIEIEIKTSKSDIKADLKKRFRHNSNLFKELWFAVPKNLENDPNIPERAGIITVEDKGSYRKVKRVRNPTRNKNAKAWSEAKKHKLVHLGLMRIWGLKEKLQAQKNKMKASREGGK